MRNRPETKPYLGGGISYWETIADGHVRRVHISETTYSNVKSARSAATQWAGTFNHHINFSTEPDGRTFLVTLTPPNDAPTPAQQRAAYQKELKAAKAAERRQRRKSAGNPADSNHPATAFWRTHSDGRPFQVAYGPGAHYKNVNSLRASLAYHLHGKPLKAKTRTYLPGILTITITKDTQQ